MADDEALDKLIGERRFGVLATLKRDGRPQLSVITHLYEVNKRTILASITDDRAKTKNLRRDPRASYTVTSEDGWSYAVAEGVGELSAVAKDPHDEAVEELIDLYRGIAGEHPDWEEYRAAMVADQRLVLRLRIERVYGLVR